MKRIDKLIEEFEYVLNKALREERTVFVYTDIRNIINKYKNNGNT